MGISPQSMLVTVVPRTSLHLTRISMSQGTVVPVAAAGGAGTGDPAALHVVTAISHWALGLLLPGLRSGATAKKLQFLSSSVLYSRPLQSLRRLHRFRHATMSSSFFARRGVPPTHSDSKNLSARRGRVFTATFILPAEQCAPTLHPNHRLVTASVFEPVITCLPVAVGSVSLVAWEKSHASYAASLLNSHTSCAALPSPDDQSNVTDWHCKMSN
mmetsp:Transcript_5851/g.14032  ORF Transcript_5851/g.14032 Transcript_5851/m.14032 type:complete len:215 (+) Transcript_5851:609-1253(+)